MNIIALFIIFFASLSIADDKSQKSLAVQSELAVPDSSKPLVIREKKFQEKPLHRVDITHTIPVPENVSRSLSAFDSDVKKSQSADTLLTKSERNITIESKAADESRGSSENVWRPSREFSLKNELILPQDFDYRVFKGVLINDIRNKKNSEGFIYLPGKIWGEQLTPLPNAVVGLSEALKKYTKLVPKIDGNLMLGSPDLHKYPFIYIGTVFPFLLTPIEEKNFREYLVNGGFAIVDNCVPDMEFSPAEGALRKMLFDVAQNIGDDAYIDMIPNNHPLYHCFFDFSGPPIGSEVAEPIVGVEPLYFAPPVLFLEGLWIKGRLAVIYCDKGYGNMWSNIGKNPAQQKFGVNLVIYSLLQEGGKGKKIDFKPENGK